MKLLLIFILSPLFLATIYDLIFYIPSSTHPNYRDLNGFYTIFLFVQCLFYLLIAVLSIYDFNQRTIQRNSFVSKRNGLGNSFYFLVLAICSTLFVFLFYSVFGDFNFEKIITNNSVFYAKSKIGTAWVFYLYQFFIFLMLYDMYKTKITGVKLIIYILCVVIIALTGGRSTIISYMVFLLFIHVVVHGCRLNFSVKIAFLFFILVIFGSNATLRHGADSNFSDYINSNAFKLDFNSSFVLQDSLDYIEANDDYYFVAIKDLVYAFIPRAIYKDKPVSTAETRLVYEDMLSDGRTTNITFGVYGNMVINFGYVGFILAPLAYLAANYKYLKLCQNIHLRRSADFLWLYFFIMFIIVLRGGFFNMRIVLSLIVVCAAVTVYDFFSRVKI